MFKRKPGLGHYNGTREEWVLAYRAARVRKRDGLDTDASQDGVWWKAQLVIYTERDATDWWSLTTADRHFILTMTDELLDEIIQESA